MPGVSYEFCRLQSEFPCPQRICERPIPDQRRFASRRRFRPRAGAGHQFHRQPVAADRHVAGPIRAAHGGRLRHHEPELFGPGGNVSLYGGSHETITPSFDYGGSAAIPSISSPAAATGTASASKIRPSASMRIHDQTDQGKFFGYMSTLIDDSTRLSIISGASYSKFQIPNNPNQVPLGDFGPATYDSTSLNENEYDRSSTTSRRCRRRATRSTPSLPSIPAMPMCTSFRISTATSFSTTLPPTSPAKAISTAPSSTPLTG